MKGITVEVTPAQEKYINDLCRELGGVQPGALLLSQAFCCISQNFPDDEGLLPGFIVALKLFVADRRLPALPIRLHNYTVDSIPGRKPKKEAA